MGKNKMGKKQIGRHKRTFIVGDVHGCFKEFLLLLKKAGYQYPADRLILLGDLINKGPDSLKVLSWVKERNITAILGNHELKFIEAVEQKQALPPVLEKLKQDMGDELTNWISYIKSWPVYVEEEDFLAIHGGLVPGEHPKDSLITQVVNMRYWDPATNSPTNDPTGPPWHDLYTGSKLVVYAHWAKQGLKIKPNSIGLDTACVYGGKLSGLWLKERQIQQVSCSRQVDEDILGQN